MITILEREDLRKSIHLSMTAFALLLRWIEPWQAAMLAVGAILLNWIVLPVSGIERSLGRHGEHYVSGVKLYPVGVLLAIVFFPLPAAAAGWAALGAGDFASNVVGRRLGKRRLPWNHRKTWVGVIAFLVAAAPVAALLLRFTWKNWVGFWVDPSTAPPPPTWGRIVTAAALASVAGATLESMRIPRVNDNLTVPLAAGLAAWLLLALA